MKQIAAPIIAFFLVFSVAYADQFLPEDQRTGKTRLWMARAIVSEVGWPTDKIKRLEQIAVAHTLITRWKQMRRNTKFLHLNLIDLTKSYCSVFNPNRKEDGNRRWLLHLYGPEKPKYWPKSASWKKHSKLWIQSVKISDMVLSGLTRNPCPGANHFGGKRAGDVPRGRMERHSCSDLFESHSRSGNTFYLVRKHKNTRVDGQQGR